MGSFHEQRFYAIRAHGPDLRFPFAAQPFTAMVDVSSAVDATRLRKYAGDLIAHGCVQAVCRGEDSFRLVEIFDSLAESGGMDKNGIPFTSMCLDEEPLTEAIHYFVLPSGLARIGLLMVIGEAGDFQSAIQDFSITVGLIQGSLGEPVYAEDDLVCFVPS